VEGRPELDFLDQGPGPKGFVVLALGFFPDAGGLFSRLFEFLLVGEPLDALAAGFVGSLGRWGRGGGATGEAP
jgi:hypothetical protein